jgi:nucleoporin GLE1
VKAGEGGAGTDPDIWASAGALAWGVQCKETLKKVRDECKEILGAPLAVRKPLDKTLRKCVNSISATKQQVVQVYQRLTAALGAEQGPRQAYCLVRVCQLLVTQGEDLERQHQLAFPVGEVVAALGKDHPAVLSIFVGLLHEKASLAIPALRKDADEAELKAVASNQKGFFMLYGALVQAHVVPDNSHGAGFGWLYLARVLNGVPVSVASSTAIESFLRIAGYSLYCSFRRQFEKLMHCISAEVLPKMRSFQDKEHAAVISRLEQYISEKRYASPPDGSDMPERDSSQEIRA